MHEQNTHSVTKTSIRDSGAGLPIHATFTKQLTLPVHVISEDNPHCSTCDRVRDIKL